MTTTKTRDISAMRAEVTLDGQALPRPLVVIIGNAATYEPVDANDTLGSYVGFGPTPLAMTFPITSNGLLREIGKSEEELKKDHSMVIRWLGASRSKPLTTTNLTNVRITSVLQARRGEHSQPVEEITARAETVSYSD